MVIGSVRPKGKPVVDSTWVFVDKYTADGLFERRKLGRWREVIRSNMASIMIRLSLPRSLKRFTVCFLLSAVIWTATLRRWMRWRRFLIPRLIRRFTWNNLKALMMRSIFALTLSCYCGKALNGLKKSPLLWFQTVRTTMVKLGFTIFSLLMSVWDFMVFFIDCSFPKERGCLKIRGFSCGHNGNVPDKSHDTYQPSNQRFPLTWYFTYNTVRRPGADEVHRKPT